MAEIKSYINRMISKADVLYQGMDWNKIKVIFISTFVWGIVAHGYMMFNKFSWNDDVTNMFFFGTTYELGRWMLEILRRIFIFFFEANCSQPFVNGMGALVCIGISAYLFTDLFQIKRKGSLIAVTGVMVTTPTVLGIFLYMFTSFAYMIGLLMCVIGVWIVCKGGKKVLSSIGGCILICCSIGVYQAWFPMAVSIFLLYFLIEVLSNRADTWKRYFGRAFYYIMICVAALILYLIINQYILESKNIIMNDHAGMNTYGIVSITGYLGRVRSAYKMFFRPGRWFYPSFISKVYKLLLLWCIILTGRKLVGCIRQKEITKVIQSIIPVLLFPLAVCFIFVLAGNAGTLMLYPYVVVYVYFIWLLENGSGNLSNYTVLCERAGLVMVLGMCIWFCRYTNVTYLKANMMQSRAISYYTTLITRIQSMEGYHEELPIAFINDNQNKSLETVTITPDYLGIPLVSDTFINDYSWKTFMHEWCGFSPQEIDGGRAEEIKKSEEVQNMDTYPNDGSIKMIDGVIVVKFANE